MVHSVYSESDIFLRELISNASDAWTSCATRRSPSPRCWRAPGRSRSASRRTPSAGTLTIADTGIGMDRQELIDNLGTIARSGTKAFINRLAEAKDGTRPDRPVRRRLLFGLHGGRPHRGDEPRAGTTKRGCGARRAARASRWRRPARSRPSRVPRGTEVVLHLKDDAKHYLEPLRDRAHRAHLLRPHPLPHRAGRRQGRAAPDQRRQRDLAAAEVRAQARGLHRRPIARSPAPSTSPP